MTGEPRTDQAYVESHESEYITPKDAVATKAQADVYNVETVLHSAGIPLEQIHAAAELNAKNARLEFETKQNEDPIRRIIGVLDTSAVSGRDQELIANGVSDLEKQRSDWKNLFDTERTRARMQGKEFSFHDTLRHAVDYGKAPTLANIEDGKPVVYFEVLGPTPLLPEEVESGIDSDRVKPSNECLEKIVHGLGILQPNDKVSNLMMLPSEGKPSFWPVNKLASNLPTHIPGIKANIFLDDNRVIVKFGVDLLEKIVALPASV